MTAAPSTADDFKAALLESALDYAKRGLPPFPLHGPVRKYVCSCSKGSDCGDNAAKHPIARLVPHGHLGATTDELTIRRWYKAEPRANIGIALPSGWAVLDIDGLEGLEAIKAEGWEIPDTVRVATARGWHYYFKTHTDIRPGADFMEHVDMRGPGGYVVAPPSMHRSTTLYEFEAGHSFDDIAVAPAPDWLYELAKRPSRKHAQALGQAGIDMAEMLRGVNEGSRDWDIFRVASKLRRSDVPYDLALEICIRMADNCNPPETEEKARQKIDSAYGRYQPAEQLDSGHGEVTLLAKDAIQVRLNSTSGPVEFTFREMQKTSFTELETELTVRLLQPGAPLDSYRSRVNLLSHNSREGVRRELTHVIGIEAKSLTILFNRAIQEAQDRFLNQPRAVRVSDIPSPTKVEYIVDQFLMDSERPSILFGPGGSLKTFVMDTVLLCVAAGHDWMGRKVQKRNVLLVDYETGQAMSGYRLRMLARGMGLEDGLANIHWWDPDGIPFYDLTEALKRDVESLNIGFIGVDHVAAACGVEPDKSEAATRFYRAMSRLKVPSVLLAHVTGNIADNPENAKRPFGTVFWENGSALTWFIRKEEQAEDSPIATVGLFQRKWNDTGRLRDFSLTFEFDQGEIIVSNSDIRDSATLLAIKGQKDVIYEALKQPMDVDELHDETGYNRDQIRNVLNRYKGMFERVPESAIQTRKGVWQRIPQTGPGSVVPVNSGFVPVAPDPQKSSGTTGTALREKVVPASEAAKALPVQPLGSTGTSGILYRKENLPGFDENDALLAAEAEAGVGTPPPDLAFELDDAPREVTTNGHVEAEVEKPGDNLPW